MKKVNYIAILGASALIFGLTGSIVIADTSETSNQDQGAAVVSNTSSDSSQDSASVISTDAAQDSAASVNSDHSTNVAQDSNAGIVSNPSADLDQDAVVVTPVAPVTPDTTSGSSNTGGSSYGGGSFGGSGGYITNVNIGSTTVTCPLITSYMKLGAMNNSADVTKLQSFLKNSEGLNVAVTGTFDANTESAVRAFQTKYMSDVMGPWGATRSSGNVYITTVKKINELACKVAKILSSDDLAIIQAYNNNAQAPVVSTPVVNEVVPTNVTTSPVGPVLQNGSTSDENASGTPDIGENTENTNTAAVTNASVFSRFWHFVKSIF